MSLLIIPDLHNHIESADEWIARFPADRILFLGDYFDNFGDTPQDAEATALWLRESLAQPNRIHLWGNHDLPYAFPDYVALFCPGFTEAKSAAVSRILNWDDHWSRLQMVHFEADISFSHAGISRRVFGAAGEGLTREGVENRCARAMQSALRADEFPDPVFTDEGIVWQRWFVMDWLEEFHQVVGHTPMPEIGVHLEHGRVNVCLDTFGRYLGWLDESGLSYMVTDTGKRVRLKP